MVKQIIDGVDKSNSEITSLTELNDVTIASVADNDLLQYNSSSGEWENNSLANVGDTTYLKLDGSNANTTIDIGSENLTTTGTAEVGTLNLGSAGVVLTTDSADTMKWTPSGAPGGFLKLDMTDLTSYKFSGQGVGGPASVAWDFNLAPTGTQDFGALFTPWNEAFATTFTGTTATLGTLVLAGGSITDTSGAISFGNETLTTTTTITGEQITSTDDIQASGIIKTIVDATVVLGLLTDNYISAGIGSDIKLGHDGTDSYLENATGDLFIRPQGTALLRDLIPVVDGGFDNSGDWTQNGDWSVGSSVAAYVTAGATTSIVLEPAVALTAVSGKTYTIKFDVVWTSGNDVKVSFGGATSANISSTGSKTVVLTATNTNSLQFLATTIKAGGNFTIDSVIIEEMGVINGAIEMEAGSSINANIIVDTDGVYDIGSSTAGLNAINISDWDDSAQALPLFRGIISRGGSDGDIYFGNDNVFTGFYVQKTVVAGSTKSDNTDDYTNLYQGNSTYTYAALNWAIASTYTGAVPDNGWVVGGGHSAGTNPTPLIFSDTGLSVSGTWLTMQLDVATNNEFLISRPVGTGIDKINLDTLDFETGGGRIRNERRATTTDTILVTDDIYFGNTDSAGWTVSLPAGVVGQTFKIINSGSSGNTLTIDSNGSEHILGTTSNHTLADGVHVYLTWDATDGWY